MTTITIRHVPDRVRDELAARAARSGRSLQEYMLAEVTRLAARPSVADWLAQVEETKQHFAIEIDAGQLVDDVAADRR